ncbi:MAG: hypothetical protein AB1656_20755 [Candidatus Omnitrophota bacterium]
MTKPRGQKGLYFGDEAAALMVQALFQLEENLETPLECNKGIERYYALVKEAGRRMPEYRMAKNHRWRLHMQKAALDRYNQLKLQKELFQEERLRTALKNGLESSDLNKAINESLAILKEPLETPRMAAFREEARRLGEESEQLFGMRNAGYAKIQQPLRDLPSLASILEEASSIQPEIKKRQLLESAIQTTQEQTRPGRIFW